MTDLNGDNPIQDEGASHPTGPQPGEAEYRDTGDRNYPASTMFDDDDDEEPGSAEDTQE